VSSTGAAWPPAAPPTTAAAAAAAPTRAGPDAAGAAGRLVSPVLLCSRIPAAPAADRAGAHERAAEGVVVQVTLTATSGAASHAGKAASTISKGSAAHKAAAATTAAAGCGAIAHA
jgi:hypothetical protein